MIDELAAYWLDVIRRKLQVQFVALIGFEFLGAGYEKASYGSHRRT